MDPILAILLLSVSGPVIGSAIGVLKKPSALFICNMLCFAAGVMLAISFLELIPEALAAAPVLVCVAGIAAGALAMYGMDLVIPHIHPSLCTQEHGCNLKRTSVYLILGIFLHNFPEGMAIAIGAVAGTKVSLTIALAIAIHNIPEGVCTSAPYYHSTGQRLRAFLVSSSTALPLVAGFALGRYVFTSISPVAVGFITGATAGLMIYITADELIPSSQAGTTHSTIFSLMAGVVFVVLLGGI